MNTMQKDPNVLSFMMQLVQQKHGDNIDAKFLEEESNKLYDEFGDRLVSYFEPQLTDEQRRQFDELIKQNADQAKLIEFLLSSIENLEQKIRQALDQFRNEYIARI